VYRGVKITTFTVRASQEQARRWARVARWLRCRSVPAWLAEMAEEQCQRLEEAGVQPPPVTTAGTSIGMAKRGPYRRRRGGPKS
jgi:hypothetical protein